MTRHFTASTEDPTRLGLREQLLQHFADELVFCPAPWSNPRLGF